MPPAPMRSTIRNWPSDLPTREFISSLLSNPIASRLPIFLPTGKAVARLSRSSGITAKGTLVSRQSNTSCCRFRSKTVPYGHHALSGGRVLLGVFLTRLYRLNRPMSREKPGRFFILPIIMFLDLLEVPLL